MSLRDCIINNCKVKNDNIWDYILDLVPKQMIEYRKILPQSGKENSWLNSLSNTLKKKLKKLDK
jgi:hypothetical protein